MTSGRDVLLREAARRDVDDAISFYLREGAPDAALEFVEALEKVVQRVATHPEAGSPRYGHELALPGLRCCPVGRFPHLLFYFLRGDVIDVWRVLHGERDVPMWLRE